MDTKILEIRDEATFIPVLAIRTRADNDVEGYYFRGSGYGDDMVLMVSLTDCVAGYDPFEWDSRTYSVAHRYIGENFDGLESGDVVDVQYILEETDEPKVSERLS